MNTRIFEQLKVIRNGARIKRTFRFWSETDWKQRQKRHIKKLMRKWRKNRKNFTSFIRQWENEMYAMYTQTLERNILSNIIEIHDTSYTKSLKNIYLREYFLLIFSFRTSFFNKNWTFWIKPGFNAEKDTMEPLVYWRHCVKLDKC